MAKPERTPTADAIAHGAPSPPSIQGTLIAVFASPVAEYLLRYGADLGYRTILLDPARTLPGVTVVTSIEAAAPDADTDVVVTDHHRDELGLMLRDALAVRTRWIGLMGNPRHVGPHHKLLAELDVPAEEIARVHRPIGLNIGSRRPPEIAISTLAGLLADRNDRSGGFF